jgi:hypothetical protein
MEVNTKGDFDVFIELEFISVNLLVIVVFWVNYL